MSQAAEIHDLETLSNGELVVLLKRLDAEELHVSKLRSVLHLMIASLRAGGDDTPESAAELESALSKEREISSRRLQLHKEINALRIERSRRLSSLRTRALTAVE